MDEQRLEKLVALGAQSAERVLVRFLKDETRFKGVRFQIEDSDREGLHALLASWAMARRQ